MTQILDDAANEVIRNLALQKITAAEIHRRLLDGTAGLDHKYSISLRSVQLKCQRARQEAEPEDEVPEDADAYAELHLRSALASSTREVRRIRSKKNKTAQDAVAMREWTRTVGEIRRHLAAARARSKNPGQAKGGDNQPKSTLEILAEKAQADRNGAGVNEGSAQPASSDLPTNTTNGETGSSGTEHSDYDTPKAAEIVGAVPAQHAPDTELDRPSSAQDIAADQGT